MMPTRTDTISAREMKPYWNGPARVSEVVLNPPFKHIVILGRNGPGRSV